MAKKLVYIIELDVPEDAKLDDVMRQHERVRATIKDSSWSPHLYMYTDKTAQRVIKSL